MAHTQKFSIKAPDDPEINVKVRDNLEYYVTLPSDYNDQITYGLVFCIPGFGDTADSEYQTNKLRPFLSDKYNFITVGVRYHNDERFSGSGFSFNFNGLCSLYNLPTDYFINIKNGDEALNALFGILISRNLKSLDPRVSLQCMPYHQYSSFGFMPAIDHLFVLSDVLKRFLIDKKNIIAFGSSYGGYVASLMAKYAPQTFSMIIDNSGYVVSSLQEVIGGIDGNVGGSIFRVIDNIRYEITYKPNTLWSLDETSKYYFSDSHKHIRSLLIEQNREKSSTIYSIYHSSGDRVVPIEQKRKLYNILTKYNIVYHKEIKANDIDGLIFKNLDHGMNASLRGIFDISMIEYIKNNQSKDNPGWPPKIPHLWPLENPPPAHR